MAKQIYIDENGNEQLVSGTINTADLLPIESGSATNTKDYIDSGLSGKSKVTITTENDSGTTNASGNVGTNIDFTNTILNVYAVASGYNYHCLIRPTGTNKVSAIVLNDSLQPLANSSVTIYVTKMVIT